MPPFTDIGSVHEAVERCPPIKQCRFVPPAVDTARLKQPSGRRATIARVAQPFEHVHRQRRWLRAECPALTGSEVLELALAFVISPQKAGVIASALIDQFGTFGAAVTAPAQELMMVEGMTEAAVVALKTVREAAIHMARRPVVDGPGISCWDDLTKYLTVRLSHERVEVVLAIFLDGHSQVITDEEIGRGTVDCAAIHTREIIRSCLRVDATSLILAHNHPSGVAAPSMQDKLFTDEVVRAANTMNISVIDHIIVGAKGYFSFRREKLI